jgi:hypothetical protein
MGEFECQTDLFTTEGPRSGVRAERTAFSKPGSPLQAGAFAIASVACDPRMRE